MYAILEQRQLERVRAALAGDPVDAPEVRFTVDLYTAFYGQREFGIRDPNGVTLYFYQPMTRGQSTSGRRSRRRAPPPRLRDVAGDVENARPAPTSP